MFKLYVLFLLIILILVVNLGFMLPYLFSSTSDFGVLFGVALIAITLPIVVLLTKKLIEEMDKAITKINKKTQIKEEVETK